MQHYFASKLLVSNIGKKGIPRLRVSLKTRDWEFISANGEVIFLDRMTVKRANGQIVEVDAPRISKGSKQGKYTPHYITISATKVKKYGFYPNEPVAVTIEW